MKLPKLDWKVWGCVAFFLAAIFASLFAYDYRKELQKERSEKTSLKQTIDSQRLEISHYQARSEKLTMELVEKEFQLNQSQKGHKSETIGADGSKKTEESWENTSQEISRQLQIQSEQLKEMKSANESLSSALVESKASEKALSEKISLIETKTQRFRSWGVLAGRKSVGLGYHMNLGILDLGAYAKNDSYTELAPSWELNVRF